LRDERPGSTGRFFGGVVDLDRLVRLAIDTDGTSVSVPETVAARRHRRGAGEAVERITRSVSTGAGQAARR
jgi:hypothetical protein